MKKKPHIIEMLVAMGALAVSYCYAPMMLWNWFLSGPVPPLTPLRSAALVLLCRVFVGIRTRDPRATLNDDLRDIWATVGTLWLCVLIGYLIHWVES